MRKHNGHGSHSQIPNVSHVFLLITFMLNPTLMIAPVTSLPLMTADTTELLVATTTDPLLRFVKNVVVVVDLVASVPISGFWGTGEPIAIVEPRAT